MDHGFSASSHDGSIASSPPDYLAQMLLSRNLADLCTGMRYTSRNSHWQFIGPSLDVIINIVVCGERSDGRVDLI
jgi:hypothetical protein